MTLVENLESRVLMSGTLFRGFGGSRIGDQLYAFCRSDAGNPVLVTNAEYLEAGHARKGFSDAAKLPGKVRMNEKYFQADAPFAAGSRRRLAPSPPAASEPARCH